MKTLSKLLDGMKGLHQKITITIYTYIIDEIIIHIIDILDKSVTFFKYTLTYDVTSNCISFKIGDTSIRLGK